MKKLILISSLLIISAWLGGFVYFAWKINNYRLDDSARTQAIIALTGGRNRIAEAVKLYNRGLAEKLFISGVSKKTSLNSLKKRQKLQISNEEGITLGHRAKNTVGNAKETIAWLKQNHINSIRLVTSNYHVERSITEFKAQNPNLHIIAHPVYSDKVQKKWWTSWHTFSLIFAEYNKFLCVYIRCKIFSRGNQ